MQEALKQLLAQLAFELWLLWRWLIFQLWQLWMRRYVTCMKLLKHLPVDLAYPLMLTCLRRHFGSERGGRILSEAHRQAHWKIEMSRRRVGRTNLGIPKDYAEGD